MSLSLRDLFAAHVAASLATRVDTADAIAERAYHLADALLRERARRIEQEEAEAAVFEQSGLEREPAWLDLELARRGTALLDEPPPPPSERGEEPDDRWLAAQEETWSEREGAVLSAGAGIPPGSQRPGLARTAPAGDAAREKTGS